ncbi:MAG: DUF4838 domain-containing protein [bacterium]
MINYTPETLSRRRFLARSAAGLAAGAAAVLARGETGLEEPFFQTRGVVLTPGDFTWTGWPEAAKDARLTTISLHHSQSPAHVIQFMQSPSGQRFLEQWNQLGLQAEYELHAMRELLPRDLFSKDPSLFRMDEKGERNPDANLCVHSSAALAIAAENALRIAKILKPATHRYYFWGDDGLPWCRCSQCRELGDSDQALILENYLVKALRSLDSQAQLAHLAYANSLQPPRQVQPGPGVFLEFAPIHRRYDIPFESGEDEAQRRNLEALDANLAVFGAENAQALEYWLDVSRFSQWTRPAKPLPFSPSTLRADLRTYGRRGIRHLTTFAVFIDEEYIKKYGVPPVQTYGDALYQWRPE